MKWRRIYAAVREGRDWLGLLLTVGIIAFLLGSFTPSYPYHPICGRVDPAEPAFPAVSVHIGIFDDNPLVQADGTWNTHFSIGGTNPPTIIVHYGTFSYQFQLATLGTRTQNGAECWYVGTV